MARLTRDNIGLTRITFPGYTFEQLVQIIQSRLESVPGVADAKAVEFAARKVAQVSGDARRALDICRRAVEIAETETISQSQEDEAQPATPSRTGRGNKVAPHTLSRPLKNTPDTGDQPIQRAVTSNQKGVVTISTIQQAIREATSSPLQQALRALPLASKVFLSALLARIRRTGIGEAVLGDVIDEAKKMGLMSQLQPVHDHILAWEKGRLEATNGTQHQEAAKTGSKASGLKAARALGLVVAANDLAEAGIVGVEARHGERVGRVRLGVGEDEIRLALGNDESVKGLGLST